MQPTVYVEILGFIAEAVGLLLLYNEVRYAHDSDAFHLEKAIEEHAAHDKAGPDRQKTSDAREKFAPMLADWLEQQRGMAPDTSLPFALSVLGLNQSPPPPQLMDWYVTRWMEPPKLRRRVRMLRLGTALLVLAVLIHAIALGIEARKPEPVTQPVARMNMHLRPIPADIVFDPGQALLTYSINGKAIDLTGEVCSVKKALIASGAQNAFIIGHHDQTHLRKTARATFASNEGLAERRADEVSRYLTDDNACGPGIQNAVALIGGPRATGARAGHDADLGKDRVVEVWAITP